VEVHVTVRGGRARVSVRDEGPGLPAEEQRRIWERYHRVPGVPAHAGAGAGGGGGLGLGLYISRTIIERHHGAVGVRSAPGKGATFWFALPLGPVSA
jgi:signal transduction histidine kinase